MDTETSASSQADLLKDRGNELFKRAFLYRTYCELWR